jgi:O-acetylserine/cysteine efflux transporter
LLTRYPTALVAPFALLVPCIGAIASALVFDEKFSFTRYVGMALILCGVAIVVLPLTWPPRPRRLEG